MSQETASSTHPAPLGHGSLWGWAGALWGLLGFSALLVEALSRLIPRAISLQDHSFSVGEAVAFGGILVFFAAIEGYGGFQRSFAPRAAMRAVLLVREGPRAGWLRLVLAPLFCMALIGALQRRLIINWCLFVGIIGMIAMVMRLEEPFRAMMDAGVVVGLTWGLIATGVFGVRALSGAPLDVDLELPEEDLVKTAAAACP